MSKNTQRRRSSGSGQLRGDWGTLAGKPVFTSFMVDAGSGSGLMCGTAPMVLLGVGREGAAPSAYLPLCPVEGVAQLVEQLLDCAAAVNAAFPDSHTVAG